MREILFRGKRADTGEWIEGYYCRAFRWTGDKNPTPAIQEADCYSFREIIPETVGQYTGLKDKNGKKIFEGDIVSYNGSCHKVVFESRNGTGYFGIVVGENETWGFGNSTPAYMMTVVGNIHDNADLLGENNAKEQ